MQIADTLATARAYKAAGFEEDQAQAMAEQHDATAREIHTQLTAAMTEAIGAPIARLEATIAKANADQTKFTITVAAFIVAILGLIMTALRFIH
ncbi:MAG: hypothetical protein ACHQZQ_00160 [SAR324 cluster bacterium]